MHGTCQDPGRTLRVPRRASCAIDALSVTQFVVSSAVPRRVLCLTFRLLALKLTRSAFQGLARALH